MPELIVIPMAGESSRFINAGYKLPKYMLPLDGRPLFDWCVLSFKKYFSSLDFLFVARDHNDTAKFIDERLSILGVRSAKILFISNPTAGQAETVELGLDNLGVADSEPITIFNIDTIRPGFVINAKPEQAGYIEVFKTIGDNWSFVEPDPTNIGCVLRCAEKKRISDFCCTGMYHFKSVNLFKTALSMERLNPSSHELFVAPLYNHLIQDGFKIGWNLVGSDDTILAGVPNEYESLKGRSLSELVW